VQKLLDRQADMMSAASAAGEAVSRRIGDFAQKMMQEASWRTTTRPRRAKAKSASLHLVSVNCRATETSHTASKQMFSNKSPEFRRPRVGPHRSAWLARFLELFFGAVAKLTMVVALLVFIAIELLSGGTGAGASLCDLPTTRKGRRNLFAIVVLIFIGIVGGIYLFKPTVGP
jgi:hypothetical protein